MKIKLKELLEKQNRSQYWLSKQTDITPKNIGRLANGKTTSITFENLQKICKALDCTPNDIFEIEKD